MFKIVDYHRDDIRKAAITALRQFCICFSNMKSPEGRVGEWQNLLSFLTTYLLKSVCVPVYAMCSTVSCFSIFTVM